MRRLKLISLGILIGMIILFTVQNYEVVEFQFLFWKLAMSRVLLFMTLLAVGIVMGWLLRGTKR